MKRLATLVVLSVLAACSDLPPQNSTDISTYDLRINMTLQGTPSGTRVMGSVSGPGPAPRLVEGDSLALDTPLGLVPIGLVQGSFTVDLPPLGGDVALVLDRPPGRGGGLTQAMFLAPPFAVGVPATASRAAPLTITWDTAVGPHETNLIVGGKCVAPIQRRLAGDYGTYTFNPFELSTSAGDQGACAVTIDVVKRWSPNNANYYPSSQTTRATLEMTP